MLKINAYYTIVPLSLTIGTLTLLQDETILIIDLSSQNVTFKRLNTHTIHTVPRHALSIAVDYLSN